MKCYRHVDTEALAVCANCGRAVCQPCIATAEGEPAACSQTCATQTKQQRRALDMLAAKVLRSNSVNARFLWLSGSVFLLVGLLGMFTKNAFLIIFPSTLGAIFVLAGFWYRRVGRHDGVS